jgi:hypothetical protein
MKKKFAFQNINSLNSFNSLDRRAVSYSVSTALIATVFLITMVGIFTGRYKPFASEIGQAPTSGTQQGISVPPAELQFSYSDGVRGTAQSNALSFNIGSTPQAVFSLQGIRRNANTEKNLGTSGKVSLRDSAGTVLVTSVDWGETRTFLDDTRISSLLSLSTLLDALDNLTNDAEVTYTIKPQNYLAVSARAKVSDETIIFPQAPVGDLDGNNIINGADFAIWSVHFEENVTTETSAYDFNKDGVINGADFALGYTDNFNKSGESL